MVCSAYNLFEASFVDRHFHATSYMRTYEPQFEPVNLYINICLSLSTFVLIVSKTIEVTAFAVN